MISRQHRFHGHNSLQFVFGRGQVVRGPVCLLKYTPNPQQKTWRAAVVVSRKVDKSAAVRNRIRRRIYEIIRTHLSENTPPFDLVFILHDTRAATMPARNLSQEITHQLKKAKLL